MTLEEQLARIDKACEKCRHNEDVVDTFCKDCKKPSRALRALDHHSLCLLGARWIQQEPYRCKYPWRILVEPGYRQELPDVFAFTKYSSVLIECKASRADFLRDGKKPFRANPQFGIGCRRYYLVNDGVCTQEEMPEGWQLLIAYDENTIFLPENYQAPYDHQDKGYDFDIRNATAEIELMWSWLYRKEHKCLPEIPSDPVAQINAKCWKDEAWLKEYLLENIKRRNPS